MTFMPLSVAKMRLLLLLLLCAGSLSARDLSQDEALQLRKQGHILPLEQVLQLVAERHPHSRLLEAELEEEDDRYIYEVELLTAAGQVRELEIDAATGHILKDEEDD